MLPLNICFSQNMKAKIQGLGQEVRIAFESIEYYIKSQDEKIEQLQKEKAELKSILYKALNCMNNNNDLSMGRCYTCNNGTGICESGGCVQCENWEWKYKRQAEQALKGCVDDE